MTSLTIPIYALAVLTEGDWAGVKESCKRFFRFSVISPRSDSLTVGVAEGEEVTALALEWKINELREQVSAIRGIIMVFFCILFLKIKLYHNCAVVYTAFKVFSILLPLL